jgi:putative cell wall-binding protein
VSSNIKGLRRVGIVGLSTVVAASMMSFSAVSAQADWAATGGGIGLVDTAPVGASNFVTGTQGATLVQPNVSGQALGDVRLLVPNTFQNGDTIDLAIFDRTATNLSNGQINADTAHKLGFSGTPVVTVNPTSYVAGTLVGPLSDTLGNTENAPVADTAATKGVQPPVFTTSLVASSRAGGLATDIIRLRVNSVQATLGTNAADNWIVTVSGIKADLGAAVSPGELRVVPFAYNGTSAQTSATASPLFAGNLPGVPPALPTIHLYTVPAYVSPVTFNIGAPNNIVADNTIQNVGDIAIAETNNYSLQNATYSVTVGSAVIRNTAALPVTVTTTNAATGETVTSPAVVAGNALQFTLAGASNTSKLSIKLSGLLLSDNLKGPIDYTLSGGSIDGFLATAGTSPAIPAGFVPPAVSGVGGVFADSAFGPTVNQTDIAAPALTINAVSTPVAGRIGGIDRYQTAEKIALTNGQNSTAVLASGENFPDALSSAYLANQFGASILLTHAVTLPASTIEGLRLLGTKTVYLIGGTGAISAGVEAQLLATPQYEPGGTVTVGQGKLQVIRLGGLDRYETNKIVNLRAAAVTTFPNPVDRTSITFGQASKLTALVATGEDFPDALAGGPATSGPRYGEGNGAGLPLILTKTASLTPTASSQMTALGIQQAVILGGTGAVSSSVETSISGMGVAIDRIGGANRYETATMLADFEIAPVSPTATTTGGLGFSANHAYLATGLVFADALAGGPLAGGEGAPILLTNPTTLSGPTQTWLVAHAAQYDYVTALGLGAAVSQPVLDAANVALGG